MKPIARDDRARHEDFVRSLGNDDRRVAEILRDTLTFARERRYTGWDYGDGMSSKILQSLPVENKWLNILFQESVKRAPVNIRPWLLVEQRPNYKGMAIFALANLNAHACGLEALESEACDGTDYRTETRRLVEWLVEHRTRGYSGFCGGYQHPFQALDDGGEPKDPDVVSTSYAVKALLRAGELDRRYPERARTAVDFVVEDLDYRDVSGGAIIDYHFNHGAYYTPNAGAIGARLFVDLYAHFGTTELIERATAILDYIAELQTDIGGWMYRDPPTASHLSMDSFHNGFIIESLQRYRAVTGSTRFDETIDAAMEFYRTRLFEPNGAPNWDESTSYPRDVHAAAQGILVFTYDGDLAFARQILEWTLDTLYAGGGQFYYRQQRHYTKRFTLMRWCQAWMAYAISEHLLASTQARKRGTDRTGRLPGVGTRGTTDAQ